MDKLKEKLSRLMYGRYGIDQLLSLIHLSEPTNS